MIKPAEWYDKLDDRKVVCRLCPAECSLQPGSKGICRSRFNRDGELVTDNYGELVALAVDPIEKKPLYHFYPGTNILSTGPNCCNLGCLHCQNWSISQESAPTKYLSPEDLTQAAIDSGTIGVAFTYTEPLIWFEYIKDVAQLLREAQLRVVLVTNGYLNPKPFQELLPLVDAMNIDLKGMNEQFYLKICKGKLAPVLDNIRAAYESGIHIELTNLIIPGENDDIAEIEKFIEFVASISANIPVHFSAYRPEYKMQNEPTPDSTLLELLELSRKSLNYVFLGNTRLSAGSDSNCPGCEALLIKRDGYKTEIVGMDRSDCARCGFKTMIRVN